MEENSVQQVSVKDEIISSFEATPSTFVKCEISDKQQNEKQEMSDEYRNIDFQERLTSSTDVHHVEGLNDTQDTLDESLISSHDNVNHKYETPTEIPRNDTYQIVEATKCTSVEEVPLQPNEESNEPFDNHVIDEEDSESKDIKIVVHPPSPGVL